ncbi:MAG TPA: glycosyltransferase [Acidimicrobiales bacterium]|nr:glycosyltransferase [Acidimicrobiales bacterium]
MRQLAVLSLHTSPLAQPGTGDGGGMNVYVRSLASALARAGVDCDVYTRAWRPGLAPVVSVEPGFRVHHVAAGPPAPVAVDQLGEVIDEFTGGVLRLLDREGPPDLIHANYWLSGVSGHALKHELSLPLVCTFHTLERVKASVMSDIDYPRAQAEAEVIGCADSIVASSVEERHQLEHLYGAEGARIEVVPPGVDHELFSPGDRQEARLSLGLNDDPVLLFVGRIQHLKGVDVAIEALALGPPRARLVVVGGPSGPGGEAELSRLRKLADERGVGRRVLFVPPQPHGGLAAYYRAADVCVVPSRSESFGLVALEAAACGTPVVASAVGGLRTLVEHGRTGFLVGGCDPEAFADYVTELVDQPDLAARMGSAAEGLSRRYSWSITAARLRRLCTDLTVRELVECQ